MSRALTDSDESAVSGTFKVSRRTFMLACLFLSSLAGFGGTQIGLKQATFEPDYTLTKRVEVVESKVQQQELLNQRVTVLENGFLKQGEKLDRLLDLNARFDTTLQLYMKQQEHKPDGRPQ